jgi:hypothetical protein
MIDSLPRTTQIGVLVKKYPDNFIGPREPPRFINKKAHERFVVNMFAAIEPIPKNQKFFKFF